MTITAQRVRDLLDYDAETGIATWRSFNALYGRLNCRAAGYPSPHGQMQIEIDYQPHQLHNIIWLHHYGVWPSGRIEHIDHDRTNNKISNLKLLDEELISRSSKELTACRLRALLNYDMDSGIFTWKFRRGNSKAANKDRKLSDAGYVNIRIDGKLYRAHRLAWLYVHGEWPPKFLDHVDGNRSNNRISNLREATALQNNANRRMSLANTSGYRGVTKHGDRWVSQISVNNKCVRLGVFDTKEEAFAAYMNAAKKYFGDFCPSPEQAQVKISAS